MGEMEFAGCLYVVACINSLDWVSLLPCVPTSRTAVLSMYRMYMGGMKNAIWQGYIYSHQAQPKWEDHPSYPDKASSHLHWAALEKAMTNYFCTLPRTLHDRNYKTIDNIGLDDELLGSEGTQEENANSIDDAKLKPLKPLVADVAMQEEKKKRKNQKLQRQNYNSNMEHKKQKHGKM